MKHQVRRYLTITLGTCVSGIALNAFFLPHHLLSGGITGLGMILYYLSGWQVSITNILFNIPLFILAYKLMSRNYFLSGIYGTVALSFWLHVFSPLNGMVPVHDAMLSCIAGGVLHGLVAVPVPSPRPIAALPPPPKREALAPPAAAPPP